eukprot:23452_1
MGGDWKIRIETICIMHTKQNFKYYFDSLFLFDCMCNGYDIDNHTVQPGSEQRPISTTKATASVAAFTLPPKKTPPKKTPPKKTPPKNVPILRKRAQSSINIPTAAEVIAFFAQNTANTNTAKKTPPKKTPPKKTPPKNVPILRKRAQSSINIPTAAEVIAFFAQNTANTNTAKKTPPKK